MILRIAGILFFASCTFVAATDCKTASDPAHRLACFDAPKAIRRPPVADPFAPAKAAIARKLVDPASARWGDFYTVTGGDGGPLVCGSVNAKNRMTA